MSLDASQWTAIASGAAAVAAGGSVVAAFLSNGTSKSVAKLEHDRRHSELTPQFEVACESLGQENLRLVLWLRGPAGLSQIDSLKVSIRDDKRMLPSPGGSPTQKEIEGHIWAPWRFTPAVDNASFDGRSVPYLNLKLGDKAVFQLEKSPRGSWMIDAGPGEWWRPIGISSSIKISIYCETKGFEPWTVPWDIPRQRWGTVRS